MKTVFSRRVKLALLATLAFSLLAVSAVGSSQATLTYFSEVYTAQVDIKDIGITLLENGKAVSRRDYTGSGDIWHENTGVLLANMLTDAGDSMLVLGKKYPERLAVSNSGTIDQYVRVRIFTYWMDPQTGRKITTVSPKLINIHLADNSPWILDSSATTQERMVLYYPSILPVGATTPDITDYIQIDDAVVTKVTTKVEGNTTYYTYAYDGCQFVLEAEADAVQTHNAEDAIKSSWGVDVAISGGRLSLR